MSNILAGVGRGQLCVLDERVEARRRVFQKYQSGLAKYDVIEWMPEPSWSRSNRWLTACTLDTKKIGTDVQTVIKKLAAERIEARPVWKPMQMQPVFSHCAYFSHQGRSVSQELFETGICLPSGSNMSEGQQERVIDVFASLVIR